jgi:hypothetical protein
MISQVIIGVGDGDIKNNSAPQLRQVCLGVGTMISQKLGQLQVTGIVFTIIVAELHHGKTKMLFAFDHVSAQDR